MLAIVLFIYLAIPKDWQDATTTNEDGSVSLSEEWEKTIAEKQEQYAQHELYMLTAINAGYFLCKHCPTGKFYLNLGEVYRYGTTGIGQNKRGFSRQWLNDKRLNFVIIMKGDIATVKAEEAALIGGYAILPENLARPLAGSTKAKPYWYRLVLPAGNNSLD
ncbi:MAG: hypothetical protein AAF849_00570 [Bacteroidota bacterium]